MTAPTQSLSHNSQLPTATNQLKTQTTFGWLMFPSLNETLLGGITNLAPPLPPLPIGFGEMVKWGGSFQDALWLNDEQGMSLVEQLWHLGLATISYQLFQLLCQRACCPLPIPSSVHQLASVYSICNWQISRWLKYE